MMAHEAVGAMLASSGISQAEAARRLGVGRQSVCTDVSGRMGRARPHGMQLSKLLGYAQMCGYALVLAPGDGREPITVDGVNRGVARGREGGAEGGPE